MGSTVHFQSPAVKIKGPDGWWAIRVRFGLNISHVGCTYLMNGYHNLISFCNHSCLVSMGGPTL